MSCIYKYKGKDYTKEEFYSLVSNPNFVQQEQVKKFDELQERLNNKEFLEGAKNAFESSEELQNVYYEAAGIRSDRDTTVRNSIVQAYKDKTTISLKTSLLEDLLEFDRTKDEKFYTDKELTGVENIKKLKESIKKDGLKEPLELVINSQGAVVLAEGNHRFQALKELGYKEIPVIVKGRGSKDEYFTEVRQGKQVKLGLNLNKDFNTQITPQQKQEALNAYTDFIARVSLGIVKNPTSGEYNYESKVKDIVYHGTKGYDSSGRELPHFEVFDKSLIGRSNGLRSDDMARGFYFGSWNIADRVGTRIIPAILNIEEENNTTVRRDTVDFDTKGDVFVVFEPEQIHILSSKADIEGFKDFINKEQSTSYKDLEGNIVEGELITYPSDAGNINYVKDDKGELHLLSSSEDVSLKESVKTDTNNINSLYEKFPKELASQLTPDEKIQSLREGMAWLHKRMPNVSPEFVQGLIDNVADGRYEIAEDLITLSQEFATKEVIKEEAFHRAFHALTSYTTREKLLNEASERFGIKRDGTQFIDIILEEEIANLARTAKDEIVKETAIGKFFQSLFNLLRNLFKEKSEIDRYIRNIEQARYEKFPTERGSVELNGEIEGTVNERYSLFSKVKENFNTAFKGNLNQVVENIKPGSIDVKIGGYTNLNDIYIKNLKRLRNTLKTEAKNTEIASIRASLLKDVKKIKNDIDLFDGLDEDFVAGGVILRVSGFLRTHIKNVMPDNKNFVKEDYIRINSYLNTVTHVIEELRNSYESSKAYKEKENSNEYDNLPIDESTFVIESKEQYVKNINRVIGEINSVKEILMRRANNYINEDLIKEGHSPILNESGSLKATREFDSVRANAFTDKMFNVNPLTAKMNRLIQQGVAKRKLMHDAFVKKHKQIKKEFEKSFKGKSEEIYDKFIQKDDEGRKTNYIIREENSEYLNKLSEAHKVEKYKVNSILKFHVENSDLVFNKEEFEELLQHKLEVNRQHLKAIGVPSDEVDNLIKIQENKLRKAYDDLLTRLERIRNYPDKNYSDDGYQLNYTLLKNEDFFSKKKLNGRLINPLSFKPKEQFKNKEFTRLMSLPDNNIEKIMFLHVRETLANFWANVRKPGTFVDFSTIPEMRLDKSTFNQFKDWMENLAYSNNERQTKYRDVITGEEKHQIPTYMTGDNLDISERNFDLAKIIEAAHLESTSYSVRKEVENDIMLYNEVLKSMETFKIDFNGNPIKDAKGDVSLQSMEASNLYKAMKYRIDNLIYDVKNTEDIRLRSKYSKEDIVLIQRLQKELSDFNLDQTTKDEIIKAVDNGEYYDTGDNAETLKFLNNYKEYKKVRETKLRLLSVGKIANSAMSYTAIRYLYANPLSGIAEFLQGLSVLSILAVSRRHMKEPDVWKSLAEVIKGSHKSELKVRQLSQIFGSVSEEILGTEKTISNKVMKVGFAFYQGANYVINNAILISHLKNTVITDLDGNEHKMYDVININDGVMELPDNFDQKMLYQSDGVPTEFLTDIMVKFEHILREFRDRRNANDPLMANGNWVLRALLQFKGGWLINQMVLRFGGYEEGNKYSPEKKGFYRVVLSSMTPKIIDPVTGDMRRTFNPGLVAGSVAKTFIEVYKNSALGRKFGKDEASQLEEYEQDAFRMFAREASIILSVTGAILILRILASNMDDDDDKDGIYLLLNQMIRLDRDLTTYASPNSLLSFFKNPIPTLTTITDLTKFIFMLPTAALNLKLFEDEDFGSKFINRGINLTPVRTVKSIITRGERIYDEM